MGWIILIFGLIIGFVAGILIGRKNRVKVEDVVAKVKTEYEDYKGMRG